jgi:PAP2 superfamily
MTYISNIVALAVLMTAQATAARANVVTDWDEKAVGVIQGNAPAPPPQIGPVGGLRIMTMVHVAMFDAVNAIDPRYEPYMGQTAKVPTASQEAAATAAAATVLIKMLPASAIKVKEVQDAYLAGIANGDAKDRGIKLGEEMAAKVIALRANDGHDAVNAFRPATQPGVYTETMPTYGWEFTTMTPFAMKSPSQFRPAPPIALTSEQWAKDYNEIKDIGEKNSAKRTPRQTEDARFWLTVIPGSNQPLARQIAIGRNMSVVESARFMALVTMAEMDAAIAVFDAKYHYTFWRPITAIRNGDIDDNPATERVATWQPIDLTPLHPEYPCAHCILSGAEAGAIAAILGTEEIPEVALTSPTAPGVTHKFTNLRAFNDEVSAARIAAGFHWRFSTIVGSDMGWKIGSYTVQTCMRPVKVASN